MRKVKVRFERKLLAGESKEDEGDICGTAGTEDSIRRNPRRR
jgi:hypothetical protein